MTHCGLILLLNIGNIKNLYEKSQLNAINDIHINYIDVDWVVYINSKRVELANK